MTTEESPGSPSTASDLEKALRKIIPKLPKVVRYRAENAFAHFDKAAVILPIDREMASFRAVTGEEEAATALLKALEYQNYPNWRKLKSRHHTHKAALLLCMEAVRRNIARGINNAVLEISTTACRIDVKVPLAELGVAQPFDMDLALRPVEPLDMIVTKATGDGGDGEVDLFDRELDEMSVEYKVSSPAAMVKKVASQRNSLLYATDSRLPASQATEAILRSRRSKGVAMIAITIMILQTNKHQALVLQGIDAVLGMVDRLPRDAT